MSQKVIGQTKQNMDNAEQAFQRALGKIRSGRANATLLDGVAVEYYGAHTPLNQLAQISVPEARMITVTPYDKGILEDIERAINKANLGITPSNDGTLIRLVVPQLTEERRREIAKEVGVEAENAKVSVRNHRRDSIDELRTMQKNGEISEDELHRFEKDVQYLTDNSVKNIDELASVKEQEIMED